MSVPSLIEISAGRPRNVNVARFSTRSSTSCGRDVSGRRCRRTSCRKAQRMLWEWYRTLERIHHAHVEAREQASREASPTAAIIDSQSAKAA